MPTYFTEILRNILYNMTKFEFDFHTDLGREIIAELAKLLCLSEAYSFPPHVFGASLQVCTHTHSYILIHIHALVASIFDRVRYLNYSYISSAIASGHIVGIF